MRAGAALCALAACLLLSACQLGPDATGSGEVRLTVTRDFGAEVLRTALDPEVPDGETVMRLLQRNADVETRYAGRFVTAIGDVRSSGGGGRRSDWFYYVNGIEAERGAADQEIRPDDRVWWDHHDWSTAMRVPAVVGSFPEPFVHGVDGKLFPVRVDCAADARDQCREVAGRLDRLGARPATSGLGSAAGADVLRLLVGEWPEVRRDAAAELIEEGPAESGVFARFGPAGAGRFRLDLLDERGAVGRTLLRGGALVAATRFAEQQPTWVITGTDRAGLEAAVDLFQARVLRNRFAVAAQAGRGAEAVSLPAQAAGGS